MKKIQAWLSEHYSWFAAVIYLGLAGYYGVLFYAFFVFGPRYASQDFIMSAEDIVIGFGVGIFLLAFPFLAGPFIIPNCESTDWHAISILLTLSLWFVCVFSLVCIDLFSGKEPFCSKYFYVLSISAIIVGFVFRAKRGQTIYT